MPNIFSRFRGRGRQEAPPSAPQTTFNAFEAQERELEIQELQYYAPQEEIRRKVNDWIGHIEALKRYDGLQQPIEAYLEVIRKLKKLHQARSKEDTVMDNINHQLADIGADMADAPVPSADSDELQIRLELCLETHAEHEEELQRLNDEITAEMRTFLTMTEHVEGLILEIIDAKRKEAEEAQRKAEELEKKIAEQERTIKEEKEKREQLRRRQKYLQAVVRHHGWPDAADTPEAT